jgi:small GTP-binding protein
MGGFFSSLFNRLWSSQKEYKILILGLANAGKTTLLYRLHMGLVVQTQPTIGSNVEEIAHKNVKFQAWDLGGQESIRFVWPTYTQGAHAVIFVVDSTDQKNYLLSKAEFYNLLVDSNLKDSIF